VSIWTLNATLAAFLIAAFIRDRFAWLNARADDFERIVFGGWADFDTWGDPASWVHHGFTCAVVGGAWGALAWALSIGFAVGFLHGTCAMLGFYIVREGHNAWTHHAESGWEGAVHVRPFRKWGFRTGWALDGLMDLVGPVLVALAGWAAL
jgi:hypothetical protein